MFYTIDKFDTFITHLIKLCMQSRQEPTMYADVTWIFSTLLIKISSFTSHWADLLWSNKTCSTEKKMIEPNPILWKFETQWFYPDHVGGISRKRGQMSSCSPVGLGMLWGHSVGVAVPVGHPALGGDSFWTDLEVCAVPVVTMCQDLGDESSGKLMRKAKLSMDWHLMFKYLCNNKDIGTDSRTLSVPMLFALIPGPSALFFASLSNIRSNNQISPSAVGTELSSFRQPSPKPISLWGTSEGKEHLSASFLKSTRLPGFAGSKGTPRWVFFSWVLSLPE